MTAYFARLKYSALAQSLLITTVCIIIYAIGPISSYETNDDVFYSLVFSGKLVANSPDPHAVFVNFVLSNIFVKLYTLFPGFQWFAIFQISAIFSSLFFLNYFFSITKKNDTFWVRSAVSLAGAIPFLLFIQFTKTAFVLAVTGYLGLYLLNNATLRSRAHSILLYTSASAFLVLSYTLRKESFFLATLLCSALMLSSLFRKKISFLVSASAVTIIIIIFTMAHKHNYGEDWRGFFSLQQTIGPIVDYDRISYTENKEIFEKAGLSANDFMLLKLWGYADGSIYSKERLDYIYKNSEKRNRDINIAETLNSATSLPAKNYMLTMAVLSLLILLIYRPQHKTLYLYLLLPFIICCSILLWQGRVPTRVSTAMFYFIPWAALIICGEAKNQSRATSITVVAALILVFPTYGQFIDMSKISEYRQLQNRSLHQFGALTKDPLTLVTLAEAFPYEGILPFESPDYLSGAKFIWLCGFNQSPLQKKQLAENNINDIFANLLTEKTTFITLRPEAISFLQRYIFEHYKAQTAITPVYANSNFIVYRLMTSSL